jgi:hypothetical protein
MKNAFGFHVAQTAAFRGQRALSCARPNPAVDLPKEQRVRAIELDLQEEQLVIGSMATCFDPSDANHK